MVYTGDNLAPLNVFYQQIDYYANRVNTGLNYNIMGRETDPKNMYLGNQPTIWTTDNIFWNEIDGAWLNVKPGDHIVFSVMAKTGYGLNNNAPFNGARLGIDYYVSSPQGSGIGWRDINYAFGVPDNTQNASFTHPFRLEWGHDWTQIFWDVIVPKELATYAWINDGPHSITPAYISAAVAWLDVRDGQTQAKAWFSNSQLYVNPITGGELELATITFNGTVKDTVSATPLNGASVIINVTRPDLTIDILSATVNSQGVYSIVNTYLPGNFSAQAVVKMIDYKDGVSPIVKFTVTKVNGNMTVTLNVAVA